MPTRSRLVVTGLLVLGALVLQCAWMLVMPPFAGMDEFDHAFRASAVGHGEIRTDLGNAPDGRGQLVTATDGIVADAYPICSSYEYVGPDNCTPSSDRGDGLVVIASSAAIYPPTYYLAVGWVSRFVDGTPALYAMRVLSAVLCLALFGLATWIVTGWARTMWPIVAVTLVLTPTTLYSTVVLAPNGLEMMVALVLWVALIALSAPDHSEGRLIGVAVAAAVVLAWTRPFGPIWLLLTLVAWLLLMGTRRSWTLFRTYPRAMGAAVLTVGAAAATAALWVARSPSGEAGHPHPLPGGRMQMTAEAVPLWFFQTIAGIPFRNNAAPVVVYACGLVVLGLLLAAALHCGGRPAATIGFIVLAGVLAGAWYTYTRLPTAGYLWQGRYSWCFALGAVIVAGRAVETRSIQGLKRVGAVLGVPALLVVHLATLAFVLELELRKSPLSGDSSWVTADEWVVLALGAAGVLIWVGAATVAHVHSPGVRTSA